MEEFNLYLAQKCTQFLLGEEYYQNENRKNKIEYIVHSLSDEIGKMLILSMVFWMSGFLLQYLICLLVVSLTRVYLGGIHMKTYRGCLWFSFIIYLTAIIGGSCTNISYYGCVLILFLDMLLILCFAPVPSPQRPKYSKRKKLNFKIKGSMGIFIIAMMCVIFKEYVMYMIWIIILQIIETALWAIKNLMKGGIKNADVKENSGK